MTSIWGKRCGVEGTECGFACREVSNLRLHGDWTRSTEAMQADPQFAFETMTIDSIIMGEYGFSLQGFSVGEPTTVRVTITSVKPYRLLIDRELVVDDDEWVSIGRFSIDDEGKVTDVNEVLGVEITGDNRD